MIDALRNGGDLLNVLVDFPTLTDPRHADAYSPCRDAQLGLWTPKAVAAGLNTRQIDENQVFNLAATRPDLLTGVNPATGQPAPYGSVGVDINCAVIGYTAPPHRQPAPPAATPSSPRANHRHQARRRARPGPPSCERERIPAAAHRRTCRALQRSMRAGTSACPPWSKPGGPDNKNLAADDATTCSGLDGSRMMYRRRTPFP